MNFLEVKKAIQDANMNLGKRLGNRESFLNREIVLIQRIQEIDKKYQLDEKVTMLLQRFEEEIRRQVDNEFESVNTSALQETLGDFDLEFRVVSEAKRGVISTDFLLYERSTGQLFSILVSFGGGVSDIISVIDRFVFLKKSRMAGFVVLDENFKFLSKDNTARTISFVAILVKSFGWQVIWISHDPTLLDGDTRDVVDAITRVRKVGGVSELEKIK